MIGAPRQRFLSGRVTPDDLRAQCAEAVRAHRLYRQGVGGKPQALMDRWILCKWALLRPDPSVHWPTSHWIVDQGESPDFVIEEGGRRYGLETCEAANNAERIYDRAQERENPDATGHLTYFGETEPEQDVPLTIEWIVTVIERKIRKLKIYAPPNCELVVYHNSKQMWVSDAEDWGRVFAAIRDAFAGKPVGFEAVWLLMRTPEDVEQVVRVL